MAEYDPKLVERMVALVRRCADNPSAAGDLLTMSEACAIVRELPPPIDPDLLLAREVALQHSLPAKLNNGSAFRTNLGEYDQTDFMLALVATIKRVRAEQPA